MRVEYSVRAVADIRQIADYFANSDDIPTGERLSARLREAVARVARLPGSGRPVIERPGVRIVSLPRYRYNIFYAVIGDRIRILHIRHTSRRPWTDE